MGVITEWFKWLHNLQESDRAPLLKLSPEEQTELLGALRTYPMHTRFHEFCRLFEYRYPVPTVNLSEPPARSTRAFVLEQADRTFAQQQQQWQQQEDEKERQRQEREHQERLNWELQCREQKEAEWEKQERDRKAKNRARNKASYRARKARAETRVLYNPRHDGLAEYAEIVWSDFTRMKRAEPVLPSAANTLPVRRLPQMPEEPHWEPGEELWQFYARRRRHEGLAREIREQDEHDREVAREQEVTRRGAQGLRAPDAAEEQPHQGKAQGAEPISKGAR